MYICHYKANKKYIFDRSWDICGVEEWYLSGEKVTENEYREFKLTTKLAGIDEYGSE